MFSLPRDTVDVPIPAGARPPRLGPHLRRARSTAASPRTATAPTCARATNADPRLQRPQGDPRRAVRPRHQVLRRGQLRRLQEGRRRARRRAPSTSRSRSSTTTTRRRRRRRPRLYIPTGIQHMNGAEALQYARSRHTLERLRPRPRASSALLLSLREQADPQALIPRLPELVTALKQPVKTDIPRRPARRAARPRLDRSTPTNIRSYVFSPPLYGSETRARRARLHHRPERRRGSGTPSRTRSRRNPADEAQRRGARRGGRRGLGPQRHGRRGPRHAASPATSTTTGWPRRRRARSPTGAVPADDRRSSSTTAPRPRCPRHDRVPREDVQGDGRRPATDPARPDRHRRHDRRGTPRTSRRRRSS